MKQIVKYSDLLLNTMLDTIKRENRKTIDGTDIINYEKVVKSIIKSYNLPMEFDAIKDVQKFLLEIEPYIFMSEQDNDAIYTLLPWVDLEELEQRVKNTIFIDMSFVYDATKESLRFKRDARSIQRLRGVEKQINSNFLKSTQENIYFYEQQKHNEEYKLQKMKQNLGIKD